MHLDGPGKDLAMAGGREHFGFPKKLSGIQFKLEEKKFLGWSERHNTRNIELRANFSGRFNYKETGKILVDSGLIPGKLKNPASATYNFKHFPAPEGEKFDYEPRLVKQVTDFRPKTMMLGEAELILKSSIHDPWAEVEIVKILGAIYQTGNNSMQMGEVVATVNTETYLPYSFLKWDWF